MTRACAIACALLAALASTRLAHAQDAGVADAAANVDPAAADAATSVDPGAADAATSVDAGAPDAATSVDAGVAGTLVDAVAGTENPHAHEHPSSHAATEEHPRHDRPVPPEELESGSPDFVPTLPEPEEEAPPAAGTRREIAGFPAIAANSQYGFVFGASGSLTKFKAGVDPFLLRAQLTAAVSVRNSDTGVSWPLQNVDFRLDLPSHGRRRSRLFLLARFTHVLRAGYFGIGNASSSDIPSDYLGPRDRYFLHERSVAEVRVFSRFHLGRYVEAVFGGSARWVNPVAYQDSQLARDIATAKTESNPVLRGYTQQGLFDLLVGLLIDRRDDELNPTRGSYHELSVRAGGGPSAEGALGYVGLTVNSRWFVPLVGEKLVLAFRAIADVDGGRVPLIELGTLGGYAAFAGTAGPEANRGLAPGRQLGRVKLLGSLELRSTFARFQVKKQRLGLGAVAFADTSRVFARLVPTPGTSGGPALRSSFGGGVRLLWGSAFVFRVDVGVAPHGGIDNGTSVQVTAILNQAF